MMLSKLLTEGNFNDFLVNIIIIFHGLIVASVFKRFYLLAEWKVK